MTSSDPLKVAGLGAGYFAQLHHDSWNRMNGADLVAVCDRDIAKAEASGKPAFAALEAMLEASNPDILDIVLPPDGHADAIRTALEFGVETIICQKPFGRDIDEARALTRAAEDAGKRLIIHENFRFQPWYRAIKTLLDESRLGDVQRATFRLRPGDGQGPEAYLARQPYFQQMPRFLVHETAVHWIDTFRYLFGPVNAVFADLQRLNPVIKGEDAGFILFQHEDGLRALFDGNRHLDHAAENTRCTMGEAMIEGTKASLTLLGDGSVHMRTFGERSSTEILGPTPHTTFGGDCVHALNAHVVAHLRDGTPLENTARDYLPVIEIENAIYASADGGRIVALND